MPPLAPLLVGLDPVEHLAESASRGASVAQQVQSGLMLPFCCVLRKEEHACHFTQGCHVLFRPTTGEQRTSTATLWVGCRSLWTLQQ